MSKEERIEPQTKEISRINLLPFDVHREILIHVFYFESKLSEDFEADMEQASAHGSIQNVSQVCRRWRDFALSVPTLWSSIRFTKGNTDLEWQKLQLERSKQNPIDILIWDPMPEGDTTLLTADVAHIIGLLLPHLDRWRSLQVFVSLGGIQCISELHRYSSAISLELLKLRFLDRRGQGEWRCRIFNGLRGVPNLRRLSIPLPLVPPSVYTSHLERLWEWKVDDRDWLFADSITHNQALLEDLVIFLARCRNLGSLSLIIYDDPDEDNDEMAIANAGIPVILTHLEHLKVDSRNEAFLPSRPVMRVLARIQTPLVSKVKGQGMSPRILQSIATSNPFPALRELHLIFSPFEGHAMDFFSDQLLLSAFRNLPVLESLILRELGIPSHLFDVLKHQCPFLCSIALDGCSYSFGSCCEMVKSRLTSLDVAPIERLRIGWLYDQGAGLLPMDSNDPQMVAWLYQNIQQFEMMEYNYEDRGI